MEEGDETNTTAVDRTRREVLTSIGGLLVPSLSSLRSTDTYQDIPSFSDTTTKMTNRQAIYSTTQSQQIKRPAYLVLPGGTAWTILANLPHLQQISDGQMPVILMDTHDYTRLQRIALTRTDDPFMQSVALAYKHLCQRGVIRLLDYSDFYPRTAQQKTIRRNQAILAEMNLDSQRQAAMNAAKGWIKYGRGVFYEPFRERLGGVQENYEQARQREYARRQTLERDRDRSFKRILKVLNQYSAALHIRQYADDILNLNVQAVIGEGGSSMLGGVLDAAGAHTYDDLAVDSVDLGSETIAVSTSHITRLDPSDYIMALPPSNLASMRAAIDTVGTVAAKMTGVQHDDWIQFGPTLAVPQYHDLFNLETVQEEIHDGMDTDTLVEEALQLLATLERRADDGLSTSKIEYTTEWIMEEQAMCPTRSQSQSGGLAQITGYALNLSAYSRELRTLVENGDVSQAAGLVGACLVSDSIPNVETESVRRQSKDIISRLDPQAVDKEQLTAFHRWDESWEDASDWYETVERAR